MKNKSTPENVIALLKEGIACLRGENYEGAIKTFDLVLRVAPENEPASQGKAVSLARLGEIEKAEAYLQDFLERNPESHSSRMLCTQLENSESYNFQLIPNSTEDLLRPVLNLLSVSPVIDLLKATREVRGFLTDKEAIALFHLAQNGGADGAIVEIGSFCGKSTIFLASGSKSLKRERVYAIDPHIGSPEHQDDGFAASVMPSSGSTYKEFERNITHYQLSDWVTPILKTSERANERWSEPIRVLFIDGNHDFDMVEKDFLLWSPHLVNNGLIAFHDCSKGFPGPRKVVEKHILPSRQYSTIAHVDSLYIAEKRTEE